MGQTRRGARHARQHYDGDQLPRRLSKRAALLYNQVMKYIETERLILRDWKDEDVAPFAQMNADPIIMEYFPRRLDEEATARLVERFRKHFKEHGFGPYAVEVKKTGAFAGF